MTEQVLQFGDLAIAYDEQVLTPRLWTLAQSEWAVELLTELPDGPVLELCAGAGQIGLAVAVATGHALVQVDADERACVYARRNAAAAGVDADVRCAGVDASLQDDECFPLVLADPPYIPAGEVAELPDDPEHAIDGGEDGLDLARLCLRVAAQHLAAEGRIVLQLGGPDQAATLAAEAEGYGLEAVETRTHGADRALVLLRATG